MSDGSSQVVTVHATVASYGGVIRILNDAERSGLTLMGLTVTPVRNDPDLFDLVARLCPQHDIGNDVLAARLSRHPAVLQLHLQDEASPADRIAA